MIALVAAVIAWPIAGFCALCVLWKLYIFCKYQLSFAKTQVSKPAGENGQELLLVEPPFISGWLPVLGVAVDYGKNALQYLREKRKIHGDVFTLYVAGKRMTFVLDPINIPLIFKGSKQLDFDAVSHEVGESAFGYPSHSADEELSNALLKRFITHLQGQSRVGTVVARTCLGPCVRARLAVGT